MEFEMRFEIPKTVSLLAWIEDSIYYMDSSQSGKIFRADLNLENEEFNQYANEQVKHWRLKDFVLEGMKEHNLLKKLDGKVYLLAQV